MDDTVAARLKIFMDSQGLTNTKFADMCGIPRPTLSQFITGRNKKISDVLLSQIHHTFPNLSVVWLIFNEGEMLMDDERRKICEGSKSEIDASEIPNIPPQDSKYGKENALNSSPNTHQRIDNEKSIDTQQAAVLTQQIEKMRSNPRKVLHITVYYDDSTFETFYPK